MNQELSGFVLKRNDLVSKIISVHLGPARRLSLCFSHLNYEGKMEGWLSSHALDKLQEFELILDHGFGFGMRGLIYLLPSSVYRFAPTLCVAKFGCCRFSNSIVKLSLKFPCLKQLTLDRVTISVDALQSVLSSCYVLESLELKESYGFHCLCINSQTLKSVGFCSNRCTGSVPLQELVIEDAPCLERLLPIDPQVGPGTIRSMIAVGLPTKMHSVKVLLLTTLISIIAKSVVDPQFEDCFVFCPKPNFYVAAFVSSLTLLTTLIWIVAKSVVDPHFEDCFVFCPKPKFYVDAFVSSLTLKEMIYFTQ
ncbi:Ankyrin-3 [Hordeum vulgare]|nr:Ankyrin-3 [Hordeum vulgare]